MQRHSIGMIVAIVIGAIAVILPIFLSVELAQRQSLENEKSRAMGYARDVMHRVNGARSEEQVVWATMAGLNQPVCSEGYVDAMQELALSSSYVLAVGRIEDNQLTCTSLRTKKPIELGPPDVVTERGVAEWIHVHLPMARNYPLTVVANDGIAFMVDPNLMVDVVADEKEMQIAVFAPSQKPVIIVERGEDFHPEWLRPIARGAEETSFDGDAMISTLRAADTDVQVTVVVPRMYATQQVRRFAGFFVPLGLLCGTLLVGAVAYIARIQLSLPSILKGAARRKEFFVEYQPVVELATGRWIGAEALVRWKRQGKIVYPDQFMPMAELSAVIILITARVMEQVAKDLQIFRNIDPGFRLSINLSAVDIASGKTVEHLKWLLETSGARPENIEIEVTERGFLQGAAAQKTIEEIRTMGARVAIDDFGTGYSTLSRLEMFGLDTLKIDKSFVETIDTEGVTNGVVPHIIEIAHSLKLEVVAEGVETEAQAAFLRNRGVRYAQGRLFAHPMDLQSFLGQLAGRRSSFPA